MSRILLVFSVLALAACGPTAWRNADASRTQADFNWDSNRCRLENRYRNAHLRWGEDPLNPYMVVDEERAAECMKARGWQKE